VLTRIVDNLSAQIGAGPSTEYRSKENEKRAKPQSDARKGRAAQSGRSNKMSKPRERVDIPAETAKSDDKYSADDPESVLKFKLCGLHEANLTRLGLCRKGQSR
jgi:hypothetical protein